MSINAYSLEIIRDPIFEDYFKNIQLKYDLPVANVYLVENYDVNAFVLGNNIYFTKGMIKHIKKEDVLKSIYFHEVGHIQHNHYNSKKLEINSSKKNKIYNNILSIGAAIFTGNANIGIATNLSIDQSILNNLSASSIKYEIQADNFMIENIIKSEINTSDLIKFFDSLPESNSFFKSHPPNKDRVIALEKYANFKKDKNSIIFEWIKAKYGRNSNISEFKEFWSKFNSRGGRKRCEVLRLAKTLREKDSSLSKEASVQQANATLHQQQQEQLRPQTCSDLCCCPCPTHLLPYPSSPPFPSPLPSVPQTVCLSPLWAYHQNRRVPRKHGRVTALMS